MFSPAEMKPIQQKGSIKMEKFSYEAPEMTELSAAVAEAAVIPTPVS